MVEPAKRSASLIASGIAPRKRRPNPKPGWRNHSEEVVEPAKQPACLVASALRFEEAPEQNRLAKPFRRSGGASKAISLSDRVGHCAAQAAPQSKTRMAKPFRRNGGARRDRTDDLKLAKLALSQLSYGPEPEGPGLSLLLVGKRPRGRPAAAHVCAKAKGRGRGRRRLRTLNKSGGPGKTRTSDLTLIKRAL